MNREKMVELKDGIKEMLDKTFISSKYVRMGKNTIKIVFDDAPWPATKFIELLLVRNYRVEVKLVKPNFIDVYLRNLDDYKYEPKEFLDLLEEALDLNGCWKPEPEEEEEEEE